MSYFSNDIEISSEELLGLLMQAPAAISIVSGENFVYQLANDSYLELVGKSRDQVIGLPLKEIFPELDPQLETILEDVLRTGKKFEAKEFSITIDWTNSGVPTERFLNFIYAPYFGNFEAQKKSAKGVLVFAFDVTEQVVAKREALASEEQLRLITDSLPALISYMDKKGRYKFVNQAYLKWFDKTREEIEGKTRRELVDNEETYSYMLPFEQKAFAGEPVAFELTLKKSNGATVNLDTQYLPDISPSGEVRGIIGVGHDVTLRHKALQKLEELAMELTSAISSRDDFMSIASHELKTPITSLKIQLQMTKKRIKQEAIQSAHLEKIENAVDASLKQIDRLTDLIETLLDVARIRAGKIEYSFSSIEAAVLMEDVVTQLSEQLESAHCSLQIEIPNNLVAHWDKSRIEQVIINLVSNAIKYAPGKPIIIKMIKNEDIISIIIEDQGPGIAIERQAKIFERFERATASRNISGLGLGLFIVNQIVKGHYGNISVKSTPGFGATFIVDLPICPLSAKKKLEGRE